MTGNSGTRKAARLAVVHELQQRLHDAGIFPPGNYGSSDVIEQLVADYNAGVILTSPEQRAVRATIGKVSVWGWWRRYKEHGEDGLEDCYHGSTSLWANWPELESFVEEVYNADPTLTVEAIRERIETTSSDKGWPVPSASTINRLLRRLKSASVGRHFNHRSSTAKI